MVTKWIWTIMPPLAMVLQGLVSPLFAQDKLPDNPRSVIQIADQTERSGLDFLHSNGASGELYIMESVVGGLASFDFDRDGSIDLFLPNSTSLPGSTRREDRSSKLFKNRGDGTFLDVTLPANVAQVDYSMGATAGDFDNDGFTDLYVSNFGQHRLFHNNGDGTFDDWTEKVQLKSGPYVGAGAVFLDKDQDGDLDLFVANYLVFEFQQHKVKTIGSNRFHAGPADFPPAPSFLYENDGEGRFKEVSQSSGMELTGYGMGVVAGDFDRDFDTDIIVANDGMANYYFENDGKGHFAERGIEMGVAFDGSAKSNSNMGIDCGDFDRDGWLDLFTTTYQNEMPVLYRNRQGNFFSDITNVSKVDRKLFRHVSWGTAFVDFDNDGDQDIFVAQGHFMENVETIDDRTQFKVKNVILTSLGNGTFRDQSPENGSALQVVESSRGAVLEDFDGDGDIDMVILNVNAKPTYGRNETAPQGHWCQVELIGVRSNRDGAGCEVRLVTQGRTMVAQIHLGRGYQSHFGQRLHFGLGGASRVDKIEVRWGEDHVESFGEVEIDQLNRLIEGKGIRQGLK